MDRFLRQSTAIDLPIGPFVDADGAALTGLTISQADVRLKKNNGNWAQINDATAATHEEAGWYEKEFDATDTNTVCCLMVSIQESGALPVFHTFQVLEEAIYDALFEASANAWSGAAGATQLTALSDGILTAAKIASDAITAAKIAADAITAAKIAADAITAAKLASDVGTEIAAAVLSAAAAAPIDANIQEVNDVALIGDGSATPWGPA